MSKETGFNIHETLDRLGASVGGVVYRNNLLFSKSLEAVPLSIAAPDTTAAACVLREGEWQDVAAQGPAGQFEGGCLIYRWLGYEAPTLLYMHGSGEQPYNFGRFKDNSFKKIFAGGFGPAVNLVLVAAPLHKKSQNEYIKALGYLNNYTGMLASAAATFDSLARFFKKSGCPAVYAAGFSLGGWAANVHRAFFGDNIDRYIPICSGARPSAVFTTSQYRKLTDPTARESKELLASMLDFEDEFRNNRARNCYPLMFRYDLLTELGEQGRAYEGMEMVILDKGHFTGQQAIADFREHIINSVSQ